MNMLTEWICLITKKNEDIMKTELKIPQIDFVSAKDGKINIKIGKTQTSLKWKF